MQPADCFCRQSSSFESQRVYPIGMGPPFAHSFGIGKDISGDDGVSPDKAVRADPAELVDAAERPYRGIVTDRDVTGQSRRISKDDVVPEVAIVGDMNIGHEIIVVFDRGDPATMFSSAMHRNKFPEDIMVSDFQGGGSPAVLQVLGGMTDGGEGKKSAMRPNLRGAFHRDVSSDLGEIANGNVFADG